MSTDSRACDMYPPSSISAETLTHVNYAFALISEEFQIMEMAVNDNVLWLQTTALKKRNPALKVFLSIGGWSFNDPPTQHIFSNMVGSAAATNKFIASALSIMQAYSFDGLDIDWEYP
jgi:GH18 family chitinase